MQDPPVANTNAHRVEQYYNRDHHYETQRNGQNYAKNRVTGTFRISRVDMTLLPPKILEVACRSIVQSTGICSSGYANFVRPTFKLIGVCRNNNFKRTQPLVQQALQRIVGLRHFGANSSFE